MNEEEIKTYICDFMNVIAGIKNELEELREDVAIVRTKAVEIADSLYQEKAEDEEDDEEDSEEEENLDV